MFSKNMHSKLQTFIISSWLANIQPLNLQWHYHKNLDLQKTVLHKFYVLQTACNKHTIGFWSTSQLFHVHCRL